ncbi:MAG: hypothetical protein GC199_09880 [Alphaproteobacteria bacterium]|nr:hypothetical protein [Alphaproteobacteria bacterium]
MHWLKAAALALALCVGGAMTALAYSPAEEAAFAQMGLSKNGEEWLDEVCGQPNQLQIETIDLGGEIGEVMQVIAGGPCYGQAGALTALFKVEGDEPRMLFSDLCYGITPLETTSNGVKEFYEGVPGFEFPVMAWNGAEFVRTRTMKDPSLP